MKAPTLDWVPMFIHRLKASDAWKCFTDYQFGWYWKLIVESYDSPNPGYLPNDGSVLWQLAGARTKAYFQREGQSVLSRFHGRTEDGVWIYHPVVLEVVNNQRLKLSKTKSSRRSSSLSLSLSVVDVDVVFETVQKLFSYYREKFQRASTYTLTDSRKKKCVARLCELMRSESCDLARAEQVARKAIDNLAASQWHVDHGYIDWNEQIFRSQEEFQKRVDFHPIADVAFLRRGGVSDAQFIHDPNRCYNCRQPREECVCQ